MRNISLVLGSTLALLVHVPATAQEVPNSSCVISGGTNFGTITQNCIINPAPPPLYLLMKDFELKANDDKTFSHLILVRVTATADMILAACGDGVLDVDASPWPAGMVLGPDVQQQKKCIIKRYQNVAAGKWVISVRTTAKDTKFTVQPTLQ